MRTVLLSDEELRTKLRAQRELTFGDKSNRDRAATLAGRTWRRRSISNQLLDDHYVDDAEDQTDRGLGNTKSYWSRLYMLEPDRGF